MAFGFSKFKEVLDNLKSKGTEYAGIAVDKTKDAARIAKLTVDIGSEKEALKRAFVELGKAYYEENRGTAEGLFAQLCEEVDAVFWGDDPARVDYAALFAGRFELLELAKKEGYKLSDEQLEGVAGGYRTYCSDND